MRFIGMRWEQETMRKTPSTEGDAKNPGSPVPSRATRNSYEGCRAERYLLPCSETV